MTARPLRQLAYRYRWIYDSVTAVSSVAVGGVQRLRSLGVELLIDRLPPGSAVLDLCCGSGDAAAPFMAAGFDVSGLDISARALELAAKRYPALKLVQGLAEKPPLEASTFAAIQLSLALHEFPAEERWCLLEAAKTLLLPGGWLVIVDLHPAGAGLAPLQNLFCALFETETAIDFLALPFEQELTKRGWQVERKDLLAGGTLQRLLCTPELMKS